jgi:hypothetical protein
VALDAARTALRAAAYEEMERSPGPEEMEPLPEASFTEAVDVARSAVRAGATDVTVVSLEARHEMPAAAFEIHEALAEGIKFVHRRGRPASGRVQGPSVWKRPACFRCSTVRRCSHCPGRPGSATAGTVIPPSVRRWTHRSLQRTAHHRRAPRVNNDGGDFNSRSVGGGDAVHGPAA